MSGASPPPGALVAERYRILALLGRGGSGEVYQVHDLKLDQEVALKRLSPSLAGNPAALARFHREVRLARQISHPNVCRIFDIGESGGRPFLTMELIDGENLASLLLRIGRLLPAKGLEIARQLCAGLAAIHGSGVLHRDLKPANIMIDGRGQARITDFGISALAGDPADRTRAGTPAYMAPEQLAGSGATVRSDIYSLGLVLHELLTGRRAAPAAVRRGPAGPAGATPLPVPPPSDLCPDLDPEVDDAVLACLQREPSARPASARQVAALLSGLDPLAAAVAAGDTPSPAVVAAAGSAGNLRPAAGLACLAGVLVACACIVGYAHETHLLARVPLPHSPEVLADRAEAMLPRLGASGPAAEVYTGVESNPSCPGRISGPVPDTANRWPSAAHLCPVLVFSYRRSPQPLIPEGSRVIRRDPPLAIPGEVSLLLDPEGWLYRFERVPPVFLPAGPAAPPDWAPLFSAAGLDPRRFRPVAPAPASTAYVDARAAWEGSRAGPPDPSPRVRIEAGSLRGTPIYFRLVELGKMAGSSADSRWYAGAVLIHNSFQVAVACLALLLAVRNVRLGRADTRWALRLGGFVCGAFLLISLLSAAAVPEEPGCWQRFLGKSLGMAGLIVTCYLGLEPTLRKNRPERIVSWLRLLSGRLGDPLVGRDVAVGTLLGTGMTLVLGAGWVLGQWAGGTGAATIRLDLVQGTAAGFLGYLLANLMVSLLIPLSFLIFLTALRTVLRHEFLAVAACWALETAMLLLLDDGPALTAPLVGLACALFVLAWARFGLLAGVVQYLTFIISMDYLAMIGDLSAWYAWVGIFGLAAVLGLATYGCLVATGGQAWLRAPLPAEA